MYFKFKPFNCPGYGKDKIIIREEKRKGKYLLCLALISCSENKFDPSCGQLALRCLQTGLGKVCPTIERRVDACMVRENGRPGTAPATSILQRAVGAFDVSMDGSKEEMGRFHCKTGFGRQNSHTFFIEALPGIS